MPQQGLCLCLYEAKDRAVVAALNQLANLPSQRIVPAMTLAMPPVAIG
jgi:hypothetical protein